MQHHENATNTGLIICNNIWQLLDMSSGVQCHFTASDPFMAPLSFALYTWSAEVFYANTKTGILFPLICIIVNI